MFGGPELIDLHPWGKVDPNTRRRRIDLNGNDHDRRGNDTREHKDEKHPGHDSSQAFAIRHTRHGRGDGKKDEGHDGRKQEIQEDIAEGLEDGRLFLEDDPEDGTEQDRQDQKQ